MLVDASTPKLVLATTKSRRLTFCAITRSLLFFVEQFEKTDAARGIPGPPDPVGVGRININPSVIRLCVRQRKLRESSGFGIEPGDLVDVLFAKPNEFAPWISLYRIHAGIFRSRRVHCHLQ